MRKKVLKYIGRIAIAVVILIVASTAYNIFRDIPLFSLPVVDLEGQQVDIQELYKDKTTIINFWATWCKPCIAEMPVFESVGQSLDKNEWQIIFVSDEPLEKIKEFKNSKNYSSLFLKLTKKNGDVGIVALPKTIVIGKGGKVLYKKTGKITEGAEQFAKRLQLLISEN